MLVYYVKYFSGFFLHFKWKLTCGYLYGPTWLPPAHTSNLDLLLLAGHQLFLSLWISGLRSYHCCLPLILGSLVYKMVLQICISWILYLKFLGLTTIATFYTFCPSTYHHCNLVVCLFTCFYYTYPSLLSTQSSKEICLIHHYLADT